MERPSHISFHASHMSRRLPLLALAALLQVGAALLIMTGLGHTRLIPPGVLRFIPDIKQPTIDPPAPPVPPEIKPVLPRVDTPLVIIDPVPGSTGIHAQTGPAMEKPLPPAPPDHPAIGIASTHTIPPYPAIAIRQGAQGQVLLRLTVLETGRVARAEVVTGSGSEALDRAAQAWIVSHWAYRPALDHGQAVASQTLASVTFNLKDAR